MRRPYNRIRRREPAPGFTLIELVMVLLLLGIVLLAGFPLVRSTLDRTRLDAACEELAAAVRYAQSLSMQEGVSYGVAFDSALNQVRCYQKSTSATILDPIDKKPYVVDFGAEERLKGVMLLSASFGGAGFLEFDSLGEIPAGGTAVLQYSGLTRTVRVDAPTGKVVIQ